MMALERMNLNQNSSENVVFAKKKKIWKGHIRKMTIPERKKMTIVNTTNLKKDNSEKDKSQKGQFRKTNI